jgi:hypothetical protein
LTRRLPHPDAIATDEEVSEAHDLDSPVELVETGRAVARGPVGLAFAVAIDLSPTTALLEHLADALDRGPRRRLAAKRKRKSKR